MHAIAAADGVADEVLLPGGIQFGAGHDPFPHFALDFAQKLFRRRVRDQRSLRDDRNVGCRRFHVGHDVGRKNHDAFAGELRQQVAKAHSLLRIEAGSRFVDDQQLRIIEQRLRDSDALLHATGEAAQRAFADVGEIDELKEFVNPPFRSAESRPLTAARYSRNSTALRFG